MSAPGAEALAARLVVGLAGPRLRAEEAAWLARWRPAGVILFARNVTDAGQVLTLCRRLHALLPRGAEIVADQEGGPVAVLAAAAGRPPAAWGLGLIDDPELTRRVHRQTGARLRELGIDRVLAPVADVLTEPRNPVIAARAFGADAERVARHAAAAVTGLREGGVRCCVKHWPGHGGTAGDSHDGAVAIDAAPSDQPFRAAVAAGADAVMIGHLPDAAAGPGAPPATLDVAAIRRLRERLGGADLRLFADDITMGALRPPLRAAGIAPGPGDAGAGLIDPSALGLDWLAGVAGGGCDRLLCRGLPLRALPPDPAGTGSGGGGAPVGGEFAGAGASRPPLAPGAYEDAFARLARACGGDPFAGSRGPLLWLDATAGDRWGEALALAPQIERRFPAGVARVAGFPEAGPPVADRTALLVTSHRPLAPAGREALQSLPWNPEGRALALGHPSLPADLGVALPRAWRLAWLPDVAAEALAALWGAGGGSS